MGKPTTSAEHMKKWHKNKENREKELQKKRDRYSARTPELNEEQLKINHENKQLWKAKSYMLQKESYSWQKLQGMKLKDWNWKRNKRNSEIPDNTAISRIWIQLVFFYALFWVSRIMSGNEVTRQLA